MVKTIDNMQRTSVPGIIGAPAFRENRERKARGAEVARRRAPHVVIIIENMTDSAAGPARMAAGASAEIRRLAG